MWYHRKTDRVRAFRLPTQPDENINNDLVLMLNEREIGEKWVSMGDETIKIETPMGIKFATWGDWIINQGDDLFVMNDAAFQENFDFVPMRDPIKNPDKEWVSRIKYNYVKEKLIFD